MNLFSLQYMGERTEFRLTIRIFLNFCVLGRAFQGFRHLASETEQQHDHWV